MGVRGWGGGQDQHLGKLQRMARCCVVPRCVFEDTFSNFTYLWLRYSSPWSSLKIRHRDAGSVYHCEINMSLYRDSCVWVFIMRSVSYTYAKSCTGGTITRCVLADVTQHDAFTFNVSACVCLELAIHYVKSIHAVPLECHGAVCAFILAIIQRTHIWFDVSAPRLHTVVVAFSSFFITV